MPPRWPLVLRRHSVASLGVFQVLGESHSLVVVT